MWKSSPAIEIDDRTVLVSIENCKPPSYINDISLHCRWNLWCIFIIEHFTRRRMLISRDDGSHDHNGHGCSKCSCNFYPRCQHRLGSNISANLFYCQLTLPFSILLCGLHLTHKHLLVGSRILGYYRPSYPTLANLLMYLVMASLTTFLATYFSRELSIVSFMALTI